MNNEKSNPQQSSLKEKTEYCRNCSYCIWLIGLGQGVRCHHPQNQHYLPSGQCSPVLIGHIPQNCKFKNIISIKETNSI